MKNKKWVGDRPNKTKRNILSQSSHRNGNSNNHLNAIIKVVVLIQTIFAIIKVIEREIDPILLSNDGLLLYPLLPNPNLTP